MRLLKKKNEHRYRKKNTGNIEYTGIFTDRGQLYKTLNYDLTSHRVVNT